DQRRARPPGRGGPFSRQSDHAGRAAARRGRAGDRGGRGLEWRRPDGALGQVPPTPASPRPAGGAPGTRPHRPGALRVLSARSGAARAERRGAARHRRAVTVRRGQPPEWTTRRERGTTATIRFIVWVALSLGRRAARLLLYPICGYFLAFSPGSR